MDDGSFARLLPLIHGDPFARINMDMSRMAVEHFGGRAQPDRATVYSKEVKLDGERLCDATTPQAAILIAQALNQLAFELLPAKPKPQPG